MSGIFGFFNRDGAPASQVGVETMRAAMAQWGPDGIGAWSEGCAALAQLRLFSTNEARHERLPCADEERNVVFTAAARIDNRDELRSHLGISDSGIADGELLRCAYTRWGRDCAKHVYGDWSFAAWHPSERTMHVARDHCGNTSMYYYADARMFAFASSNSALLALNLSPLQIDELYLGQLLISSSAYEGDRTIHRGIKRLPPAHWIAVTPDRVDARAYWLMDDVSELRLRDRGEYVAAFREVFDEAVRARLRSRGPVAATLSGGLDSGAVAATAAVLLRTEGKRLAAFTAVPNHDVRAFEGEYFGNELSFAQANADHAGNIDVLPITAGTITPLAAMRRGLQIFNEPAHAASNLFWLHAMFDAARAHGCRSMLTGQMGNATISWAGDPLSQPLLHQIRALGGRGWLKARLRRGLPVYVLQAIARRRLDPQWYRSTAIRPAFALRLNLAERRLQDVDEWPRMPIDDRIRILRPGRSLVGALNAQMGAACGLEIRDPTADVRVVMFTLSIPDRVFIDPETGMNRWLIREAMKTRLPDTVRLNRRLGIQAADLVPRLRAIADEVDVVLDELSRGPADEYVDVGHMREVWQLIRMNDSPRAFRTAITILTRGIMAGLFINEFDTHKV